MAKMTGIQRAKKAGATLREFKKTTEAQRVPNAIVGAAAMAGGAAVGGAVEAYIGEEIAGMPTALVASLFTLGLGLGLAEPWLIYAAAGLGSNAIHDATFNAISDMQTPTLSAVNSATGGQ
jgi:hypothetical protein